MASQFTLEELENELKRRQGVVSSESVLAPETGALDEFKKAAVSTLKGSAAGILDIVGGWGNLYDYLKGKTGKEPSTLSSQGLKEAVKGLGVDLQSIEGYKGAYTVGRTGAPAAGLSALGLPGLFGRSAAGLAGEFGVAGGTGLLAETVAPDSPLAQLALQSTPYAIKGGLSMGRQAAAKPTGELRPDVNQLLTVGPLTPGEATGSRVQLAREARVEKTPSIEEKGSTFRREQAQSVEGYLNDLFSKSSTASPASAEAVTQRVTTSLDNFGRSLSSKLRTDAMRDFNAAKRAGGRVDTQPVIDAVKAQINQIAPETVGLQGLRSQLGRILDEFYVEAKPSTATPSMVVDASGAPAFVQTTPAVPAGANKIDIGRLQQNLSAWGEAAYTGKFDIGGANVLEGVAPGQAKGIARAVLRGYKDALDNAIDSGVPGAEQLAKARDKFAANLRQIDEFADKPFVKTFGKTANELVPEQVLSKLATLPESQRNVMVSLLGSDAPDVLNAIRRTQFDKILSKAEATGAAAESPTFSLEKALTEMDKKKGEFGFLFENPAQRQAAIQAMQYMRTVLKTAEGGADGLSGSTLYSTTRAAGGASNLANAVKEIGLLFKDIVASPNVLADVIFNKETVDALIAAKNKTTPQKIGNALASLGKVASVQGLRAGPRMGETNVNTGAPVQEMTSGPSLEDLLKEAEKRGLTVE